MRPDGPMIDPAEPSQSTGERFRAALGNGSSSTSFAWSSDPSRRLDELEESPREGGVDLRELLREGEGVVAERGGGGRGERGGVAGVVVCAAGVVVCAAGVVGQRGDGRTGLGGPCECATWSVIRVRVRVRVRQP